ncbi:MAG: extracellular solute-binding protein [Pseudomonadota bacterium]
MRAGLPELGRGRRCRLVGTGLLLLCCFDSPALWAAAEASPAADGFVSQASGITYQHGYGFLTTPKYPAHAAHFDYINPLAPKGGSYRFREMGNWDSFNPVPLRGRVVVGTSFWVKEWRYLWDSMLRDALDEPASYYGLIAEGVAVAEDGAWIAFKIRDQARWHDGKPLTHEDVMWTFEVATTIAKPEITEPMSVFSHAEVVAPNEVKFHVHEAYRGNPVLPIRLGNMPIMPKHYWETRDITKTTVEPPLGSGPYKIGKFKVGRFVEYDRVQDYWAADLPVNVGHWNFDTVRWEYFRDDQVQTEAVKAHVLDAHMESVPRTWHTSYDIPATREGYLKMDRYQLNRPAGLWWPLFFNLDQPRFQDRRVREAFWLLGDYPWGARRSYSFYGEGVSFFTGSELAATGLPNELELKFLEPVRHLVPERVFTHEWTSQPNTGHGYNRDNVIRAAALLKEAGWIVEDGRLINAQTREPFDVRFLAVSAELGRSFISYTKRLHRLGITTSIAAPEISNWLYRIRSGDFDLGAIWFLPDYTPTQLVKNQFYSTAADMDYSYNWGNMRDKAVDHLIDALHEAKTWDEFVAAARALDRVLLWNFYFLPGASRTDVSLVWWDKYDMPAYEGKLSRSPHIMTWWWNEEKAARVRAFTGDG